MRREPHPNEGLVDWLLACPERDFFVPVGSESMESRGMKVVKPCRRRYKLSELVGKFRPKHRHGEWELGGPVGREVW